MDLVAPEIVAPLRNHWYVSESGVGFHVPALALSTPPSTLSPESVATLRSLLVLWYDHLRGPGRYAGDVLLFSNVRDVERPGLLVQPFHEVPADPRRAFLHRALWYEHVPAREYDVALQMDLDVLAVSDVHDLFPRDERLWAAPSDLRMLEWRHAWTLLPHR